MYKPLLNVQVFWVFQNTSGPNVELGHMLWYNVRPMFKSSHVQISRQDLVLSGLKHLTRVQFHMRPVKLSNRPTIETIDYLT